jgi:hypothetical protein
MNYSASLFHPPFEGRKRVIQSREHEADTYSASRTVLAGRVFQRDALGRGFLSVGKGRGGEVYRSSEFVGLVDLFTHSSSFLSLRVRTSFDISQHNLVF